MVADLINGVGDGCLVDLEIDEGGVGVGELVVDVGEVVGVGCELLVSKVEGLDD